MIYIYYKYNKYKSKLLTTKMDTIYLWEQLYYIIYNITNYHNNNYKFITYKSYLELLNNIKRLPDNISNRIKDPSIMNFDERVSLFYILLDTGIDAMQTIINNNSNIEKQFIKTKLFMFNSIINMYLKGFIFNSNYNDLPLNIEEIKYDLLIYYDQSIYKYGLRTYIL